MSEHRSRGYRPGSLQDESPRARDIALNQIFGCQIAPGALADARGILVAGARQVESATAQRPWQVQLFAYPDTHLQVFVSQERQSCVYVWGTPTHSQVHRSDIPAWCAEVVAQKHFCRFRELLGTFVAIVDEPLERRVTFIADILGIRPMFIGQHQGRMVFGSDVWALHHSGITSDECDYDAVSSWLAYGYNCTGGSLFADLRRLPPGTAVVIQDGRASEVAYTTFEVDSSSCSSKEAASEIHEIVSSSTKILLAERSRLTIPLSGGFDSRYLLALCLREGAAIERIVNVRFTKQEGEVAQRVADCLKVPIEIFPVDKAVWDLYDEVHHFMADGFPISKFVTHLVAERYPDVPMINGFLGDSLVRGSNDTCLGKYEHELPGDLAGALQQRHLAISFDLFRSQIARRIQARSRVPMEEAVKRGVDKVFGWADLYLRQRHYISNNFLQHLGLAEAVIPFYSWPLISYKMTHAYKRFNKDVYRRIFTNYFPALADIPHASDVNHSNRRAQVATCTRRWARRLLVPLCKQNQLDLLAKKQCIPLVMLATSPLTSISRRLAYIVEDALLTCQRLYLLEQRIEDARLDFDWSRI